jgi:anti-sigma factor RsiW
MSCEVFDDGVDELALGLVDEPERGRLLAHAAACPRCQARLDELVVLAERLLLVAPEIEPPAGFEARAVERMGAGPVAPAGRSGRAVRWIATVAAVAAVGVLALTVGIAVGRSATSEQPPVASRSGVIVATSGADVGTVSLLSTPRPHILVSVAEPRPGPGVRTCELELPDGRRVVVGTWTFDEISTGIWAVGLDPALLDAVAMRVVAEDGSILASAALS